MQTINGTAKFDFTQKSFMLYGFPSIQLFTAAHNLQGAFQKKENLLVFVLKGEFHLNVGRMHHVLDAGHMAVLSKDTLVEYTIRCSPPQEGEIRYLVVTLSTELVTEFAKLAALPVYSIDEIDPLMVAAIDTGLQKYIDFLEVYFAQAYEVEDNLVKIKLLELLFYLSRYFPAFLTLILDIKEHYRVDVTHAVENNMLNSLSLSQLAAMSGRSLSSFRRDFLAIYKMPPSQWIRQKRLEKAKELLQATNMTITDICYAIGFENIAHFSRLFKSQFRKSPSEYRQAAYTV